MMACGLFCAITLKAIDLRVMGTNGRSNTVQRELARNSIDCPNRGLLKFATMGFSCICLTNNETFSFSA